MDGFHFHLGVLSEKHSQELFEKIAFGNGRVRKTPELVKIGERIVIRCGGVPLALTTIGGLLSSQRNENEWRKIEESNVWNLLDKVSSAIKLSFDHLPSLSIKQCFIYCSIFPKDKTIEKVDLIRQWMAHGLLNPSRESELEMEMVGNNYFKILLQRSLLQEDECDDLFGNIISCKMHDLVHDFAFETSKGRCLIINKAGQVYTDNIMNVVHLSIEFDESFYRASSNISKIEFSRLRTLNLIGRKNSTHHFLDRCNCKNLRALTIYDKRMNELPISIAKMKHLRYLEIFNTSIGGPLPKFVSKLYNMQTLKTILITRLPENVVRLFNLRHLNIKNFCYGMCHEDYFVPWISKFHHLRTLNCFPVSRQNGCRIEELCNLNYLEGSLHIAGLENVVDQEDAKKANLSRKCYIDRLVLVWCKNNNALLTPSMNDQSVLEGLQPHPCLKALTIEQFRGKCVPSWILTLQNLMSLTLDGLENCEKFPPLGHLPFLKFLKMSRLKSLKYITNDFYGWPNLVIHSTDPHHHTYIPSKIEIFPSLVKLRVDSLFHLEEWSDMIIPSFFSSSSIVAFPNLKDVKISCCYSLNFLPPVLFSTPTILESLSIYWCSELIYIPNMSNFRSLENLEIHFCPKLQVLPLGLNTCISLKNLFFSSPANVIESLILPYLANLKNLSLFLFDYIIDPYKNYCTPSSSKSEPYRSSSSNVEHAKLFGDHGYKFLPEQFFHFTSLRHLGIYVFPELESIPEWLGKFQFLESLWLECCESLGNFPSKEVMYSLTNLNYLSIIECPILQKRCNRKRGVEWHKIAHIPKRFIFNDSTEDDESSCDNS